MAEKLVCPICGEPTRVYMGNARKDRLCAKHADELKAGTLIRNEDGTYSEKSITHIPAAPKTKPIEENTDELTCLLCNKPSNGKHFCRECYFKFKEREIDIHIKNCKEVIIVDEYGNRKVPCKDGRKVRSRAEKIIADFFFDNHIRVIYEKDIPYEKDGQEKTLHPDFFLPDYGPEINGRKKGLIIEYNELENEDYLKSKKYSMQIYIDKGFEVMVLTSKDIDDDLMRLKRKFDLI